jgi:hypothetical protein
VHLLNLIFAAFAILSGVLALWQWSAARKLPLHQKIAGGNFAPWRPGVKIRSCIWRGSRFPSSGLAVP